jgi:hypothetical protein
MGFRFRRSLKLLPGIRINLGKRGASLSVGVRGAHTTFGRRGTRTTVGIPGTGLSYTALQRHHEGDRQGVPDGRKPNDLRHPLLLLILSLAALAFLFAHLFG